MGRPKGSKNKSSDSVTKTEKPQSDKKVNFTILNRFLSNAADLFADMSLEYRERAAMQTETIKMLNSLGGLEVKMPTEPVTVAKEEVSGPQQQKQQDESPTDLGAIFNTPTDEQ